MNIVKKIKLLKDVKKTFDEKKIEFFPMYGTLLGFVRNKEIMPYDSDIDIGIWYQDYDKLKSLKKDFEKLGYKLMIGKGKYDHVNICYSGDSDELKNSVYKKRIYNKKGWYIVDVVFHIGIDFLAKDEDKVVVLKFFDENIFNKYFGNIGKKLDYIYHKKNPKGRFVLLIIWFYNFFSMVYYAMILLTRLYKVFPYEYYEKVKTIKIYNMDIKIPINSEKYLEQLYGKNWRIPIGTNRSYPKAMKRRRRRGVEKYFIKNRGLRNLFIKRGNIYIEELNSKQKE